MAGLVAILEDDGDRVAAMRACLDEALPGTEVIFFEDAQKMIAWLGEHLAEVVLISLDHDLPVRNDAGKRLDCGTGRQVADFLGSMPATCPVIVHSSNDSCASGMFFALKEAGWPCSRIYPSEDTAWVGASWADQVRRYMREGWIGPRTR